MEYIGFDYHKQYTFATSINTTNGLIRKAIISNTPESVKSFIKDPANTHAVLESSRTWHVFYELIKDHVASVKLAHPLRVKAISAAKIKTDKIDSRILAELLSADLIPEAHIRNEANREKQTILRNRVFLVTMRTRVKNRIHYLVDSQPHVIRKQVAGLTDLFGKAGISWLRTVQEFSKKDRLLLNQLLKVLDLLNLIIAESDKIIETLLAKDEDARLLKTMPGIGPFLAVLISTEIDDINRFSDAQHLASYTGLIPSTSGSGGRFSHGRITKQGNKWLRWGFIEAATTAKNHNAQLNGYYERLCRRIGKKKANVALARRMVTIVYSMLQNQRAFELYRKPNRNYRAS